MAQPRPLPLLLLHQFNHSLQEVRSYLEVSQQRSTIISAMFQSSLSLRKMKFVSLLLGISLVVVQATSKSDQTQRALRSRAKTKQRLNS